MWLENIKNDDMLKAWLRHSPAMKLVSTVDGKILWANTAFCEWSHYTLSELRELTWMQISVPDKNLEADIAETKRLDAYNPSYIVKKQYIPKGSKPEWGNLTVMRYPLHGEIECCLCTWEPLKNGTAVAFAMAIEHTQKLDAKVEALTTEIKTVAAQTDEDKFLISASRMIQRHPKMAVCLLVVSLSVLGVNSVAELLQRIGVIQPPAMIERGNQNGRP